MRFLPNIRYGTERYPEEIARRLRALNVAAWLWFLEGRRSGSDAEPPVRAGRSIAG